MFFGEVSLMHLKEPAPQLYFLLNQPQGPGIWGCFVLKFPCPILSTHSEEMGQPPCLFSGRTAEDPRSHQGRPRASILPVLSSSTFSKYDPMA